MHACHMVSVVPEKSLKFKWFSVKGTERGSFLELLSELWGKSCCSVKTWISQRRPKVKPKQFCFNPTVFYTAGTGFCVLWQYCINLKTSTINILLHKFRIYVANTTRLWYRIMKPAGSQCVTIRDVTVSSLSQHGSFKWWVCLLLPIILCTPLSCAGLVVEWK